MFKTATCTKSYPEIWRFSSGISHNSLAKWNFITVLKQIFNSEQFPLDSQLKSLSSFVIYGDQANLSLNEKYVYSFALHKTA